MMISLSATASPATSAQGALPEAVPYCFRHSSIVRMLRQNVNVRLVAALDDMSVAMIEKHSAAYIVDALEDSRR